MVADSDRAVSPVISTILLVAIAVILAATISTFALGFAEQTGESAPVVGQSTAELRAFESGSDEQILETAHVAGDTLTVADLEIVVDADDACGKTGRIVNLPLKSGNNIDANNVEGADIFDGRSVTRWGSTPHILLESEWASGEAFAFRIKKGACRIDGGDTVELLVVHEPSESIVIEKTLTAT
jgi:flagellin-like protein